MRVRDRIESATRLMFGTYHTIPGFREDVTQTWLVIAPWGEDRAFSVVIGGRWGVYLARMPRPATETAPEATQPPRRVSVDHRDAPDPSEER